MIFFVGQVTLERLALSYQGELYYPSRSMHDKYEMTWCMKCRGRLVTWKKMGKCTSGREVLKYSAYLGKL